MLYAGRERAAGRGGSGNRSLSSHLNIEFDHKLHSDYTRRQIVPDGPDNAWRSGRDECDALGSSHTRTSTLPNTFDGRMNSEQRTPRHAKDDAF